MTLHGRWLWRLCALLVLLTACSSDTKPAASASSASSSAAPSATIHCPSYDQPTWPRSGQLPATSADQAAAAGRAFVTNELGGVAVETPGNVVSTQYGCSVSASIGELTGEIDFAQTAPGQLVPTGFDFGGDTGHSMSVFGRHVTSTFAADCAHCTAFEMHVRYGDAPAIDVQSAASTMNADLAVDTKTPGAYVFVARSSDGRLQHVRGRTIPAGDFAAS